MKQKLFLFLVFLGLSLLFSTCAKAQEQQETIDYNAEYSRECNIKYCVVPSPTLRKPENDKYYTTQNIYLTGLTWNETKISVYLDDKYIGQATVVTDKSGVGSFYYKVPENISSGVHLWSVIAWTLNKYGRSEVSSKNTFEIVIKEKKFVDLSSNSKQENSTTSDNGIISSVKVSEPSVSVIIQDDNNNVNVSVKKSEEKKLVVDEKLVQIDSSENYIKSSTTENLQKATPDENIKESIKQDLDYSSKKVNNRKIGIGLLLIIIFISLINMIISKKKQ